MLPPAIDIPSISGRQRKPTLLELKAVRDLRHLVRYLEHVFFLRTRTEDAWGPGAAHFLDESPHLLPSWQEGFYRAAYRCFIGGAVLARFYLEPILVARADNDWFVARLARDVDMETGDPDTRINEIPMSPRELAFMNRFPIYHFTPHLDWDSCFGHFGDWLIGEYRRRHSCDRDRGDASKVVGIEDRESLLLKEILQILVMYGQLSDMKGSLLGITIKPFWSRDRHHPDGSCSCEHQLQPDEDDDGTNTEEQVHRERTRKVPVVLFGNYIPEEVAVSKNVTDFGKESCILNVPYWMIEETDSMPELQGLCGLMHCMSGRSNHVNGHPGPHPPLHFFSFLLRKSFGYQFDELAFEGDAPDSIAYAKFIPHGRIFTSQ